MENNEKKPVVPTTNSRADIVNGIDENRRAAASTTNNDGRVPYDKLPYDDPAVVNPQELASFPPPAGKISEEALESENEERNVSLKKSPVRDGRNIVRTDTTAGNDGGYL
ncbi:hypothetical protein [Flavobacterium rhizosphaerae]|uniref:Uncharacterized protein n=1 Tax=Flavobacterium rhizosphaerae TaxID=3163298 RepID=A0ABW8YWX2_9FLAO